MQWVRRIVAVVVCSVAATLVTARVAAAEPPSNDDLSEYLWLDGHSETSWDFALDTTAASSQVGERPGGQSVWFGYSSERYALAVTTCGSTYETLIEVYRWGTVPEALEMIATDTGGASCGGGASELRAWEGRGVPILIRVAAAPGSTAGELNLHFRTVTNDDINNAVDISNWNFPGFFDSVASAATAAGDDPLLDGTPMTGSVWFRFRAPVTRQMSADICEGHMGSSPPRIGVFTRSGGGALQQVSVPGRCHFDPGVKVGPNADFRALAGQTYWVAVDDPNPMPAEALDFEDYNATYMLIAPHATDDHEAGDGLTLIPAVRAVDTRASGNRLAPHSWLDVQVADTGSIPAGVTAVAVNLTAVEPSHGGWLSAVKPGAPPGLTSTVNFGAGSTRANSAVVPVDSGGRVRVVNGSAGSVDVIVDVNGFIRPEHRPEGMNSMQPSRLLDTRLNGGLPMTMSDLAVMVFQPQSWDRNGAVLQLTVTDASHGGHLTAYAEGSTFPPTSNLNWQAGETISNRVVVPVGPSGRVVLHHGGPGSVHVVVDQVGWAGPVSWSPGGIHVVETARLLDTRINNTSLHARETRRVPVAGHLGVPPLDVAPAMPNAVLLNVTVTNTTAPGWLAAYSAVTQPPTSDLNWAPWETRANLVYAPLAPDGTVTFYNAHGSADLIIDVLGWTD